MKTALLAANGLITYRSQYNAAGPNLLVTTTGEVGIAPGKYPGAIVVAEPGTGVAVLYHKVRPLAQRRGMRYETFNGAAVLKVVRIA